MSGFRQSLALVEAKKAALVIIAHDVELVAFRWIEGMPKAFL
jgi:ribosomal protein L7Ae-like RNA K-turn-binding protein